MTLGERLRIARENADLSQVLVKTKTGINNKTLSNYENDVSSPDPITLKTLADLYSVTTDWLISGANNLEITKAHPDPEISQLLKDNGIAKIKLVKDLTIDELKMLIEIGKAIKNNKKTVD